MSIPPWSHAMFSVPKLQDCRANKLDRSGRRLRLRKRTTRPQINEERSRAYGRTAVACVAGGCRYRRHVHRSHRRRARTPASLRRAKVPSVPSDPSIAVLDALDKLFAEGIDPADISQFVHGTTVATNALLEGKGVRTGLLITRGLSRGVRGARLVAAARQRSARHVLSKAAAAGAAVADRRGARAARLSRRGRHRRSTRRALRGAVRRLKAKGVEAIAVCFLFSFLNPGARAARRRDRRRGCAGLPHLAVVERAAGHPRISAAVDDGDRCLCRPDHRRLSEAPRTSAWTSAA